MQRLPPLVITSSLLTFLSERDKFAHVTHICRSFPVLTSASFRYDRIELPVQCVRQRHLLYWQRYCQLVSSCWSLWITDRASWADRARLLTFHRLQSLVLQTSDAAESFFTALSSSPSSLSAPAFPSLAQLSVDSLPDVYALPGIAALHHDLPALRQLTVRRHPLTRSEFRCLLALPLVQLDLSDCQYGQSEDALAAAPVPVSCPTLRMLQLPTRETERERDGQEPALLGSDVCLDGLTSLRCLGTRADELANLLSIRASLTALDIQHASNAALSHLLPPNELPALASIRIDGSGDEELSEAVCGRVLQQYAGALFHLHLELDQLDGEECVRLLQTVIAGGRRLHTLALLGAGVATFDELSVGSLPALRTLELGGMRSDDELRAMLTACPNIRHLRLDPNNLFGADKPWLDVDVRVIGALCRELVTLELDDFPFAHSLTAHTATVAAAPPCRPLFPRLRAVAIRATSESEERGIRESNLRQRTIAVVSLFAAAPRLQYFLLADPASPADLQAAADGLLSAMRPLRQATQLRSLFIQSTAAHMQPPTSLTPYALASRHTNHSIDSATHTRAQLLSQHWTDGDSHPHTAEQVEDEVAEVVQRMRTAAGKSAHERWEVSFWQETVEDGKSCRQAFFDELDSAAKADAARRRDEETTNQQNRKRLRTRESAAV